MLEEGGGGIGERGCRKVALQRVERTWGFRLRAQWQVREVQHRQQPRLGREAGTCDSSKHWGRLIGSRLAKRANSVQFYVGAVLYALSFPGVPAFFFCVCVRFLGERGMGFSKCSDLETRKVREETRNPKPLSHGRFGNRWVPSPPRAF